MSSSQLGGGKAVFQLTTSRRGRPHRRRRIVRNICLSTHDLTKRSTYRNRGHCEYTIFQLTTSRRGRPRISFQDSAIGKSFNSRPHEEVDPPAACMASFMVSLSTHDLTKRSTAANYELKHIADLSTHDLTKRSTCPALISTHNLLLSTHDLTKRST